ncbi:MAG: NUDIX domain-containing protein [Balneolaceae bacterium]
MKRLIDLYIYRVRDPSFEYLMLKRADKKIYSGQWRMVGGKVRSDESYWQAALREMKEETGLQPQLFWSVPTLNHFYEPSSDQIHLIPAFAAEVHAEAVPVLDDEHSRYEWHEATEASNRVFWPEQKRLILTIDQILSTDQWLDSWNIPLG